MNTETGSRVDEVETIDPPDAEAASGFDAEAAAASVEHRSFEVEVADSRQLCCPASIPAAAGESGTPRPSG